MCDNYVKILIIEDNPDDLFFIQKALSGLKHSAKVISRGTEAYQYLLNPSEVPDIILLDYKLPGMDGLEILRKLKESGMEYSFIFLTIDNSISTVIEAMKNGALDFIRKSVSLKQELPGKIEKVYEIHNNRIEKKKISEELRRSKLIAEENGTRYRTLVDAVFDAIVVTENENIVELNKRAEELSGYSYKELLGENITKLLTDNSQEVLDHINHQDSNHIESRILKKDGTILWVVINPRKARLNGKEVIISSIRDVTESRLMEIKLRQSEKMSAIGQLAGGIAHDFNNQLSPIIGYADMLSHQLENPQYKQYAQNILHSAIKSADQIKKLLSFARKGHVVLESVEIHGRIKGLLEIFERGLDKNITVKQVFNKGHLIISADINQFESAILSLLKNARDAINNEGLITVTTGTLELSPKDDLCKLNHLFPGQYLKISISDTGCGISDENKKKVFEPFFTTKEIGKGSGMGLASAYGAIKEHKGYISFTSKNGIGTDFNIFLPLESDLSRTMVSDGELSVETERQNCILIVDDEQDLRNMLKEFLTIDNQKVYSCSNGREALEYYKNPELVFDLVILDLVMPEMEGFETYIKMKEIRPDVKVLISSGYDMNIELQKLLDAGASGFIQKPFMLNELRERIKSILA